MLRGTRVLAKVSDSGEPQASGGRVEIRYKPGASKSYRAAVGNLQWLDGELLPDSHCGPADEAAPRQKKSASASAGPPPPVEDGAIIAYTAGACSGNPGPAGLGVVIEQDGKRRELSEYLGHATNNVAELTAILRAAEAIEDVSLPVVLHTDSQYAIGVLTKGWKPKKNQTLIAEIKRAIGRLKKLRFVYVKGHAGIPLNERADELARRAVEDRGSRPWEPA